MNCSIAAFKNGLLVVEKNGDKYFIAIGSLQQVLSFFK